MRKIVFLILLSFVFTSLYSQNITRKALMGLKLIEVNDSIKSALNLTSKDGLLVTSVTPNSTADAGGIKVNDVLLKVNGTVLSSVKSYRDAVKNIRVTDAVKFDLRRGSEDVASIV